MLTTPSVSRAKDDNDDDAAWVTARCVPGDDEDEDETIDRRNKDDDRDDNMES